MGLAVYVGGFEDEDGCIGLGIVFYCDSVGDLRGKYVFCYSVKYMFGLEFREFEV